MVQYAFNRDMARNMMFETSNDPLPTQLVGAVGTAAKPGFTWLAAKGKKTDKDVENCITVTMMSSVTLTSASANDFTKITLSGLTESGTSDTKQLKLYAGSGCDWEPAAADVHDNTNSLRAASGTAVQPLAPEGTCKGSVPRSRGGRRGFPDIRTLRRPSFPPSLQSRVLE